MNKQNWLPTLALAIIGLGILFLLLGAAAAGLGSLFDLFSDQGTAASEMISAAVFGFLVLILGICFWFVLQKSRGLESADAQVTFPFALWQVGLVIVTTGIGVGVGGLVTLAEMEWLNWLFLPLLTLLVIVPPIVVFYGLGSRGLTAGPRWRFFAIFGLSLTAGPFLMIVTEMVLLLVIVIVGLTYLATTQPDLIQEITQFASVVRQTTDEDTLLGLLAPYLSSPVLIGLGLTYIAMLVPLIEELFKPLAVWLFARQIDSPAQGFVLGMLSGTAFGLFESLSASAEGNTGWAVVVAARSGTSLLHMTTSALMGWGIASAFKEKKIGRLAAAYFTAVLIHGVWNALAAGAGLASIGEYLGRPEWLFNYTPALICGLFILGMMVLAILIRSNRKMRAAMVPPPEEQVQLPS